MVNRSLNQVLMRSLNTSIVAVLPVASLLFVGSFVLGGQTLKDFALALFVGLLVGAYSSIFVATPILAWFKERQPKYRALRERAAVDLARAEARTRRTAPASVAPDDASAADAPADFVAEDLVDEPDGVLTDAPAVVSMVPEPAPTRGSANPRPRQQRSKGKKKRR